MKYLIFALLMIPFYSDATTYSSLHPKIESQNKYRVRIWTHKNRIASAMNLGREVCEDYGREADDYYNTLEKRRKFKLIEVECKRVYRPKYREYETTIIVDPWYNPYPYYSTPRYYRYHRPRYRPRYRPRHRRPAPRRSYDAPRPTPKRNTFGK